MAIPRFFCPVALLTGSTFDLPPDAARHACRVLRLSEGDEVTLFDGAGGEFAGMIVAIARDKVTVTLGDRLGVERESPLAVTLVQALQTGDKMDMTVQKAVELGVASIVPVASRRSVLKLEGERAVRRVAHWRAVAVSACEQCGRNRIPEIRPMMKLTDWCAEPTEMLKLNLHPRANFGISQLSNIPAQGVRLLIGSEGGLSAQEIEMTEQQQFQSVLLGKRILRTETAALTAITALQVCFGDLG